MTVENYKTKQKIYTFPNIRKAFLLWENVNGIYTNTNLINSNDYNYLFNHKSGKSLSYGN